MPLLPHPRVSNIAVMGSTSRRVVAVYAVVAWLLPTAVIWAAFMASDMIGVVVPAVFTVVVEVSATGFAVEEAVRTARAKQNGTMRAALAAVTFAVAAALTMALVVLALMSAYRLFYIIAIAQYTAAGFCLISAHALVPVTAADAEDHVNEVDDIERSGENDLEGGACVAHERQVEGLDEKWSAAAFGLMVAAMAAVRAAHAARESARGRVQGGEGISIGGCDDGGNDNHAVGVSGSEEPHAFGVSGSEEPQSFSVAV